MTAMATGAKASKRFMWTVSSRVRLLVVLHGVVVDNLATYHIYYTLSYGILVRTPSRRRRRGGRSDGRAVGSRRGVGARRDEPAQRNRARPARVHDLHDQPVAVAPQRSAGAPP